MTDRTQEIKASRPERREVLLWLPVMAGPVAWILAEQLSYMLAPTACWQGRHLMLHLVPLATLAIAAAGAAFARVLGRRQPEASTETGDPQASRRRFMALYGFWSCLGFALAILATEVPNLVLRVCD
jgi:hypothetical protein